MTRRRSLGGALEHLMSSMSAWAKSTEEEGAEKDGAAGAGAGLGAGLGGQVT